MNSGGDNVMTFYRFVPLDALEDWREQIEDEAAARGLRGTVLLAAEGINGTLTGTHENLVRFGEWLTAAQPFAGMQCRYSAASKENRVFYRLKVRIRPEIVSLGVPVRPALRTGVHVDAPAWNRLLEDPDVLVIDTRNSYEIEVGSFPAAVDPGTRTFREFPGFVDRELDPVRHSRVAMFCTGGIRCEKASAYLLEQGFSEVYQLDGGVLKYLETVDPEENRWQGECFVFDQRVSVSESLAEGSFGQCYACRRALSPADMRSADYVEGVSCPHCAHRLSEQQTARFRERRRQVLLAQQRGTQHVGLAQSADSGQLRENEEASE